MALALIVGAVGDARPLGVRGRLSLRLAALAILAFAFGTRQANSWTGVFFPTLCALAFGCQIGVPSRGKLRKSVRLNVRTHVRLGTENAVRFIAENPWSVKVTEVNGSTTQGQC
jgi:hypothetical protein